jgi:GNAT superfamily N-acetyltransferase
MTAETGHEARHTVRHTVRHEVRHEAGHGVRSAVPADRGAVERTVLAAYGHWAEVIGMRPLPMDADYGRLIREGHVFVVGPADGLIVLVPEDDVLLVENVAVRPSSQGRGVGRSLLAFAERRARLLGLPALRLYTNEKMTSNISLYTSLGYRLGYRETARELHAGRHTVHMRKDLPPPA